MATITKKQLVDSIATKHHMKHKVVHNIVRNFLDEITAELAKGSRLEFRDFGIFETKEKAARMAQNPKTMEKVHVPAKRMVKFKTGKLMSEKVNGQHTINS